eukprot:CAMPEP_0184312258 /NCGR_PEP_ID=MMETSP1049-20130417/48408_1 /TAXON_ID=77928 /ORGANISM="Proteomonas sulcata, Strain CCMP704" /LENGTH=126 /DNA_ID=CAMNT_0026628255 /DNA_START=113 /DNA_END=491 /DNA_ORIENTATION=+
MMERLSRNVFGTGKKSATAGVGILLDKTLASGEVVVKALLHGSVAKQSGIICQNDVLETVNGNELPQHPTLANPVPLDGVLPGESVNNLGIGAVYRRMQGSEGTSLFLQFHRKGWMISSTLPPSLK